MAKKSKPVGPPWFDGKDEQLVLSQLRLAWDVGATDREACWHAGISESALYRYIQQHIELRDEKELRKENMILKARMVVNGEIMNGNPDTAKWLLERKKKDEFSTKTENLNTNINANAENEDIVARLMNIPLKKKKHADSPKDSKRRKV